jgi:hypothetical protein
MPRADLRCDRSWPPAQPLAAMAFCTSSVPWAAPLAGTCSSARSVTCARRCANCSGTVSPRPRWMPWVSVMWAASNEPPARAQDGARGRALAGQHQHGGHHGLGCSASRICRREQRFGHARGRRGRQALTRMWYLARLRWPASASGPPGPAWRRRSWPGQSCRYRPVDEVVITNASVLLRHHVRPHGLAAVAAPIRCTSTTRRKSAMSILAKTCRAGCRRC